MNSGSKEQQSGRCAAPPNNVHRSVEQRNSEFCCFNWPLHSTWWDCASARAQTKRLSPRTPLMGRSCSGVDVEMSRHLASKHRADLPFLERQEPSRRHLEGLPLALSPRLSPLPDLDISRNLRGSSQRLLGPVGTSGAVAVSGRRVFISPSGRQSRVQASSQSQRLP
jgi:hypothetical protein